MNPTMGRGSRVTLFQAAAMAACVALFILARARWLGHLLTWDEAMNICTTRSFAAGGEDYYSPYIWWHPPLLNLLWLLIRPLEAGFVARAEYLALVIGCTSLTMTTWLNARVFGMRVALASALCLSLMPGDAFFSLWFKQDSLMVPFGLAALLCFLGRRHIACGIFLGLALLTKEMAAFYIFAVGVLWLLRPGGERKGRDLVVAGGVAALVSGWWYLFFSSTFRFYLSFATGGQMAEENLALYAQPWYYFLRTLLQDLGPTGIFLAVAGLVALAFNRAARPARFWALALLLPAYLAISLGKGKAAWFVASLYPAWATLQALGLCGLIDAVTQFLDKRGLSLGREPAAACLLRPLLVAVASLLLFINLWRWDFEGFLKKQEIRMWWSSNASREAAQTLNRAAGPDEPVLITPMHYYGRVKYPCPIFVVYLKNVPVLVRPNDMKLDQFLSAIRLNRVCWAMISPPAETAARDLLQPLYRDHGIRPTVLKGALVLKTSSLWQPEPSAAPAQE